MNRNRTVVARGSESWRGDGSRHLGARPRHSIILASRLYVTIKPAPQSAARKANRTTRGGKSFSSIPPKCPKFLFEARVRKYHIHPRHARAKSGLPVPRCPCLFPLDSSPINNKTRSCTLMRQPAHAYRDVSNAFERVVNSAVANQVRRKRTITASLRRCE
jgi:hypothetical protein